MAWAIAAESGLADALAGMFAAFPDLRWNMSETIVEGDLVVNCSTWTGAHRGVLRHPGDGSQCPVEAWTKERYRDGRLVQGRIIIIVVGMLTQLGVLPAPTPP